MELAKGSKNSKTKMRVRGNKDFDFIYLFVGEISESNVLVK